MFRLEFSTMKYLSYIHHANIREVSYLRVLIMNYIKYN